MDFHLPIYRAIGAMDDAWPYHDPEGAHPLHDAAKVASGVKSILIALGIGLDWNGF